MPYTFEIDAARPIEVVSRYEIAVYFTHACGSGSPNVATPALWAFTHPAYGPVGEHEIATIELQQTGSPPIYDKVLITFVNRLSPGAWTAIPNTAKSDPDPPEYPTGVTISGSAGSFTIKTVDRDDGAMHQSTAAGRCWRGTVKAKHHSRY